MSTKDVLKQISNNSPIGVLFYGENRANVNAINFSLRIREITRLEGIIRPNLLDNPFIKEKKDEFINKGLIKLQFPLNLEKNTKFW